MKNQKRQARGQHWQPPAPAAKARLGELWAGFVALMDVVQCRL